jgi:hypothetical protein
MALDELAMRKAKRTNMSFEGRQIEALEEIADSLFTIQSDLADMRATMRGLVHMKGRQMSSAGPGSGGR